MMGIDGYLNELTHGPLFDSLIIAGGAAILVAAILLALLPRHRRGNRHSGDNGNSHSTHRVR